MPSQSVRVFDLEQPRTDSMPIHPAHRPGYNYVLHRHHEDTIGLDGPRTSASGMIVCMEHTGTHIDAFCHQADSMLLCGGTPINAKVQSSKGFKVHGVETIPPIVAPGMLLDMTAHFGVQALEPGYAISAAELQACCARQNVGIAAGDVVLVYTGNELAWDD
ncbi:MAG TPA: cyclase family protein, partial [Roseiflexaceae bacterium]|nr:cyclase family protein [Roseiflexaceae bacterium]